MIDLRTILIAFDGSEDSLNALRYAEQMKRIFEARLILLHVLPRSAAKSGSGGASKAGCWKTLVDELPSEIGRLLEEYDPLPDTSLYLQYGAATQKIIETAEEVSADMIVMGSVGKGLKEAIVGGTARRVIEGVACWVLCVPKANMTTWKPVLPDQLVLATTFPRAFQKLFLRLINVSRRLKAGLNLLYVREEGDSDKPEVIHPGYVPVDITGMTRSAVRYRIRKYVEHLVPCGNRKMPRIFIKKGSETKEILNCLHTQNRLIVLGSRHIAGWRILLPGGVIKNVLRNTDVPVLIVRGADKLEKVENKFKSVSEKISDLSLQKTGALQNEESPLSEPLGRKEPADKFFMGYYGEKGLREALTRYGIFQLIEKKGYHDFVMRLNCSDPYRQRLRVYSDGKYDEEKLLLDLVLKPGVLTDRDDLPDSLPQKVIQYVQIEWLLTRDHAQLCRSPQNLLPGQNVGGLGIGKEIFVLLMIMAERLEKDALIAVPDHFHNAILFGSRFKFLHPKYEAWVQALKRDTAGYTLHELAWLLENAKVIDDVTKKVFQWQGKTQILPISQPLKKYYNSFEYFTELNEYLKNYCFKIVD